MRWPMPIRRCWAGFPHHKSYSEATMEQILAILPKPAGQVQATTLASMVFFNRSNHFEAVELPYEAQIAPAFAVNVGDFDGDGNEDIFLSQNFFELAPLAVVNMLRLPQSGGRQDAGRGLWLRGTGGGKLEAVPGQKSGILVYGEQRGAALCDFDGDGRVDLAVSQNGAETKLYQNVLGKPGLRVRLAGRRESRRSGCNIAAGVWGAVWCGAGDSWRFGLLVAGQRGAGHGLPGASD